MEMIRRPNSCISFQYRSIYLDSIGGLMILYMIFMHCCQFAHIMDTSLCRSLSVVFCCFMAWFFFKSGMFHNTNRDIRGSLQNCMTKFLRPYAALMLIGYIGHVLSLIYQHDYNWTHYLLSPIKECVLGGGVHSWALPLWFLVTLFGVKIVAVWILGKNKWGGVLICGLIGWILAIVGSHYKELRPYYMVNLFPALFFYGLGAKMKEMQFRRSVFLIALIAMAASFVFPSIVDFRTNRVMGGYYALWLIYALAGIIVFNNLAKRINKSIWPITNIGRNSMYWFLIHWVVLKTVSPILRNSYPELIGLPLAVALFAILMAVMMVMYPAVYCTRLKGSLGL